MEVVLRLFAFFVAFIEWIGTAIYESYKNTSMFIDVLAWKFFNFLGVKDERGVVKFWHDNRAIASNILTIVIVLVTLMLSVLVVAPLQKQSETRVTDLNDSQVSSTWSNIKEATWGSLDMATIIPYVVIFVVIIGLIMIIGKKSGG